MLTVAGPLEPSVWAGSMSGVYFFIEPWGILGSHKINDLISSPESR